MNNDGIYKDKYSFQLKIEPYFTSKKLQIA